MQKADKQKSFHRSSKRLGTVMENIKIYNLHVNFPFWATIFENSKTKKENKHEAPK